MPACIQDSHGGDEWYPPCAAGIASKRRAGCSSSGVESTFKPRVVLTKRTLAHLRVVIAVLGMTTWLHAQPPKAAPLASVPAQIAASRQSSEKAADLPGAPGPDKAYEPVDMWKGAIDVGMCSWPVRPEWCRGSDIGAWTNSAIEFIRCGDVYIPGGKYAQKTTILKPRCVRLHGASARSTILTWIPHSGAAIVMGDGVINNFAAEGALEDLTLIGPGADTNTCAIYLGGSDGTGCAPPTSIDPSTNQDDHDNINRVSIYNAKPGGAFGVGIQWGYRAWSNTIFESDIAYNGTGIYVPHTLTATGENLSIISSAIQNNVGVGLEVGTGDNVNFTVVNTSFDYNGSWAIRNGTALTQNAVSLVNCYIAQRSQWLQNYGYMNLTGVYANDGADSGVLGYLIDNEAAFFSSLGGQFFNNGTGAILNPQGVGSTWIAPLVTSPGADGFTPTMTYIDRLGDLAPSALYTNIVNQNTPNQMAGSSACSSGTQTITFTGPRVSPPVVLVFDETTKGGVSLTEKGNWGFTVSCSGASDVFDWMVIGNPN
jgi:hypothetical protein